ncbi:MAG TPA: lipopolysaccharide biosynthesis protein [Parafilimonas sp.]|nr:lipopolysaccharide biosynthesis protein [Parafilimonas sp.]
MTKNVSAVKAGMWQLLNVLSFALIQLFFYGFFARILPKSDFGVIAIANVFIALASLLTESGLGASLIYKQDTTNGHYAVAFLFNLTIGLFFWAILFFLAKPIASFYKSDLLQPVLRVLSFNFVLQAFGSVSDFLLQKKMKFKRLFFIEVSANLISSAAGIVAALFWHLGIWALIYSILLLTMLNSIGYFLLNKEKIVYKGLRKIYFSDLFSFGAGLTLVRIVNFFNTIGINSFIGKLISLNSLGIYERTFKVMTLPGNYLGNVLDKVMFPSMARFNQNEAKLYEYYKKGLALVNAIMFSATLLLILFTREIIYIVFGETWLNTVITLRILFLCLLFRVAIRMCDSVIRAKGLVYRSARNKFINALMLIILVYIGHFWDVNGICIAIVMFSIISYVSMFALVQRSFNKSINEIFTSLLTPLKYALFIGCITVPVYYITLSLSPVFFLPLIISSIILIIVLMLVFIKFPHFVEDDVLVFFQRIKIIFRRSE